MTNKDLLFKDLCARLPYGVKIEITWWDMGEGTCINTTLELDHIDQLLNNNDDDTEIKPYLFPLSSMTEEQKNAAPFESSLLNAFINGYISLFEDEELTIDDLNRLYDWLDKNHFDYRGLIPMGLAKDASGLNIY